VEVSGPSFGVRCGLSFRGGGIRAMVVLRREGVFFCGESVCEMNLLPS